MTAPAFRAARFRGQFPRRDGVFEIVHAEGRASELVKKKEERKREEVRGGGTDRKRTGACEEKEGGSFRQRGRTHAQTLQSFFLLL